MELRPGRAGALVDSPDGVFVSGAPPGGLVTIEASLDLCGRSWQCVGEYVADRDGEVDTALDASQGGTYRGTDPFGLFWTVTLDAPYDWTLLHPMRVTLRATCDAMSVQTSYARPVLAEGVTEHVVAEAGAGVAGRLFLPERSSRAVVVIGGSLAGPGLPVTAALLAGHGVAALSLAYWGHPGTPDVLREIDVEVVGRAADWLRGQDLIDDLPPCVVGASRGSELALLAASLMPEKIGAVVAQVGSGVAWGAWGEGTDVLDTAWRFDGEPVPQVAEDEDDPEACLDDPEMVAAAEIPIERATGPVLLLSGEDDTMWSSTRLSRIAEARAERKDAADRVEHVAYPDAGHFCTLPPGFPIMSDAVLRTGGSRHGNQGARLDSWRRLLDHVGALR
ncbi:MAG: acyl-CoA thioesterase/bile acid-CoA:amino acid N-acyltransferase family protein [Nocardioides sp.]